MKRPLLVLSSAIVLLAVFLMAGAWLSLRHNITPAAAAQIKPGMTQAQVEAILGGPPGRYYRWREDQVLSVISIDAAAVRQEDWIADDFAVTVQFDDTTGRVHRVEEPTRLGGAGAGFFINGRNLVPETVRDWLGWNPPDPHILIK